MAYSVIVGHAAGRWRWAWCAALAELVERVFPKMEPTAAALRKPARPGHVRTLIVARTGAEVVHIDVMAFGLLVGLRLAEA